MSKLSNILNDYTIKPRNLTQYTAFRGVTDFTNIGQFDQFETGYSFLSVIQTPEFMNVLANRNDDVKNLQRSFVHMLEYEFRGLDGLPDMQADTMEITDGNNTARLINRVTWDTSATVTMNYFEKKGQLITKYAEYYLTGIKDRMSQAKTYHGAIRNGYILPGPENEVFTLLYYVTDNTMLRLERAVLLCNCQLNAASLSNLNSTKGTYENRELTIEFNCFPVIGELVDKAASRLLQDISGVAINNSATTATAMFSEKNPDPPNAIDSYNYKYGIMNDQNKDYLQTLSAAIKG
jgi:hypothetical protein